MADFIRTLRPVNFSQADETVLQLRTPMGQKSPDSWNRKMPPLFNNVSFSVKQLHVTHYMIMTSIDLLPMGLELTAKYTNLQI